MKPIIQQNIKNMSRQEPETFAMHMYAKSEALSQENAWYKEQVKRQQQKLFGKSSEKVSADQISLFDEAEVESTPIADESTITVVKAHSRKKKTRQLDVESLDNRTIEYTQS
jgi:hypothetical protein